MKLVNPITSVGVPEIEPSVSLNIIPSGNCGWISKVESLMLEIGVIGVISLPFSRYIGPVGKSYTVSSTVMFKLTDIIPSSLLAVTVYCVRLSISVAIPLSCPVEVLK